MPGSLRHFNLVFHALLLVGFAGFAIAAEAPGVFVFAGGVVFARAVLGRDRLMQLPPAAISWLGLTAALLCALALVGGEVSAVLGFSYLLLVLILLKLFDQRGNRDLGQVIMMSLLLMTAAAVNSANVLYGLLFIIQLILGLYLSLLLHLKSEADTASAWMHLRPGGLAAPAEATAMHRSLQRLVVAITMFAGLAGMAAFLFIPRSQAMVTPPSVGRGHARAMTGFSERVSFEQVARITQNHDIVARVSLHRAGMPYSPGDFYLRGTTLNCYTGATPVDGEGGPWEWARRPLTSSDDRLLGLVPGALITVRPPQPGTEVVEMLVDLEPTGSHVLFFLPGIIQVWAQQQLNAEYHPLDASIRTQEVLRSPLRYGALCTQQVGPKIAPPPRQEPPSGMSNRWWIAHHGLPEGSRIDPRIAAYARRPEVSGRSADGKSLAAQRPAGLEPATLDEEIAHAIERHLRQNFSYTLDLTDVSRAADEDPLVAFLYDYRRGHCEYFAGAMTLLCQSLGLQARMAIGFRVDGDEYNALGDYYVVRQSDAHAWVEVLTPRGWLTFDPTSGTAARVPRRVAPSLASRAKDFWDYIQYHWATAVVSYGEANRLSVLESIRNSMRKGSDGFKQLMERVKAWAHGEAAYRYSFDVIGGAIACFVLTALVAVLAYFYEHHRLRRRARRLGLDAASASEQRRLARELAFYDTLLRLLERSGIRRRPPQTPREFARALTHLPARAYRQVEGLTEVFYRVRFGGRPLSPLRHRWLQTALHDLSRTLEELPLQSPPV